MSYFRKPDRRQMSLYPIDLEKLIPPDHKVRLFWRVCEELDLSELYEGYKITEDSEGRPAIDPRVLLCLWLYGYSEGIFSSRKLSEVCKYRADFMWLCGGVVPEYRVLCYFRVNKNKALEAAFCKLVVALKKAGLIKWDVFFQDGSKIRADASKSSFRKMEEIERELRIAEDAYEKFSSGEGDESVRELERERRKLERKLKLIKKAAKQVERIYKKRVYRKWKGKRGCEPKKAQASITDPDCQFMVENIITKVRIPAYNVQVCVEGGSDFIVGKEVSNEATDITRLLPMIDEVKKNLGVDVIEEPYVTDGGYYTDRNLKEAKEKGVKNLFVAVYGRSGYKGAIEMREGLKEKKIQDLHRRRMGTIERVFGYIKEKGMKFRRFSVRGIEKVRAEWTLVCMAYNLIKWTNIIRAEMMGMPGG